jgi:hypothetical protein
MTDDRHSPTTAGPTPEPTPGAEPIPEPTPAVTVVAPPPASHAGTADDQPTELPFGIPPDRPEILVAAAFAGGLVAAFILRQLGGD